MSQVPNAGPTLGEPQGPQPVGTTVPQTAVPQAPAIDPAQYQQMQAERDAARQDAERLKGFQGDYTWMSQSGLLDEVRRYRQTAKDPGQFKTRLQEMEQVHSLVGDKYKAPDFKEWVESYTPNWLSQPVGAPNPGPAPQPQVPSQPAFSMDDFRAIARQEAIEANAVMEREQSFQDVTEQLARDAGLVDAQHPQTPAMQGMLRGAVEADLNSLLQGSRPPTPEEIGRSALNVLNTLIARAKVTGVAQTAPNANQAVPPLANGAGPGGQLPPKPRSQMTTAEINAAITEQIRREAASRGMAPQMAVEPDPDAHMMSFA